MAVHGGKLLVRALHNNGAKRVFCVAGESYLPVLDGLLDFPEIDVITCRQEAGVTFMAEAYGQLHNEPGLAMVTRGPGACNASIGVHSAMQASTPMVMLVGLHSIADRNKEAFQEFDLPQMFGSISKWAAVIDEVDRIPEYINRAFYVAKSGRPGPVVLGLPEEILNADLEEFDLSAIQSHEISIADGQVDQIISMINEAKKPMILSGGAGWSDETCAKLESFSSATNLPVITSFRRQDVFNHNHENYVGELGTGPNPELVKHVKDADLIFVLNARLNEITTQIYSIFETGQKIIHVHPDADVFGRSVNPDFAVQSHVTPLVDKLVARQNELNKDVWAGWRDECVATYKAWATINDEQIKDRDGVDLTAVYQKLLELLPQSAIVTTDAGNFSGWAQRYIKYGRPGRLLAPISGAMGYSIPSAVAASIEHPDRIVLGLCGDGGFLMNAQEFATAARYGAKPIIMVANNNRYGTIAMHQEREYPKRISATDLTNPDFVQYAESFGGFGVKVTDISQFEQAFNDAVASGKASVIEIDMDPWQVTTKS